jgi:hypothetical protein
MCSRAESGSDCAPMIIDKLTTILPHGAILGLAQLAG